MEGEATSAQVGGFLTALRMKGETAEEVAGMATVMKSKSLKLEITAWTDNGLVMGVRHKEFPVEGIQFHPESIMTESGKDLLKNFLVGTQ